ncbi:hypothetical protein ACJX0J_024251, partial [Zea mays]
CDNEPILHFPNGSFVYLLIYVDDMLIASHDKKKMRGDISKKFDVFKENFILSNFLDTWTEAAVFTTTS